MTYLPWLLLLSTITVRYAAARKWIWGFWVDLASVPFWAGLYVWLEQWPLLPIPFIFGYLDIQALRKWWR